MAEAVLDRATNRRHFLQSLGGGILVLFAIDAPAQESGRAHVQSGQELPQDVAAWLHIDPQGRITAFTGKVEVGQNSRTSLTQAVADELRCSPASVTLVMGDTQRTPWDMGTFGSRTTPTMAPVLRAMAAAAREQMAGLAAQQWNVDRANIDVSDGCVVNRASNAKLAFGSLAARADWTHVLGRKDCITPAFQWTAAGKSVPKLNAREIVTGTHRYPSDQRVPGMLFGKVLRPPSFGATLVSADTAAAEKMDGVKVVRDGDFVGVACRNEELAAKALAAIRAQWKQPSQPVSSRNLSEYIRRNRTSAEAPPEAQFHSEYTIAYIAHTPLEPRAAVAEWRDGHLTVWTGTQRPFGVREELASAFSLQETQVRVLMPDTGSAYGGKHSGECAVEAARLAKGASAPVKLIWTREEEFTWAYFRPAGLIEVSSSLDSNGRLALWDHRNYMSGPSGLQSPYASAKENVHFFEVDSPLREGSYRGLAATANHFARESHIDEIAHARGIDPLQFRLQNLKEPRVQAVLEAAARQFGWASYKPTETRGYGLACGMEKGGYIACCAEISLAPGRQLKVERVVEAFECGAIVNPDQLKNQIEGAIVMGLGGALFEQIEFGDGRIQSDRLSKYRVPRFSDVPKIEVVLIDRKDLPSAGAGETPIVGIAPAIANAVYSATRLRIRSMPLLPAFQTA
jgi:isoquinoline 1-oxidoreductase